MLVIAFKDRKTGRSYVDAVATKHPADTFGLFLSTYIPLNFQQLIKDPELSASRKPMISVMKEVDTEMAILMRRCTGFPRV